MIPLTVIVGIGGQGSAIAKGVHERLLDFADQHPDVEAARSLVEQSVRLFAIDTVRHPDIESGFAAGNYRILNPAGPDRWIDMRSGFDRSWWPSHILAVGSFDNGAGMMRAKGRLAYHLQGQNLAAQVVEYVTELRRVRPDANASPGSVQPAFVVIVGSLSGGTGSGIMLTLAMHIRQLLDADTKMIGAIPLASIMELGPGRDFKNRIWANCSSALRELEWWLVPREKRPERITPFFKVGNEIIGDGVTPFDLCYLFTRKNRAGQSLPDFATYTQLIADCIALDIYSPIANASQQSLSNDLQNLLPTVRPPEGKKPKPIIFGGASAAALVYPTYAVANYLGGRLLASVLDTKLLEPVDLGTQPQDWLVEQRLENRSTARLLRASLKRDIIDPNAQDKRTFPSRPNLSTLTDARKDEVRSVIERATQDFDDNAQLRTGSWVQNVSEHVRDNRRNLFTEHQQALRNEIITCLGATSGDGFQIALAFAKQVRTILKLNAADEDANITNRDTGLRATRARLDDDLRPQDARRQTPDAIEQIRQNWGFNRFANGASAKESFLNNWWNRYVDCREQLILAEAAKGLLDDLVRWLDGLVAIMDVIETDLHDARSRIAEAIKAQLGERRPGQLVFEESVLAEPRMIDDVFGGLYAQRSDPDSPDTKDLALEITATIRELLVKFDGATTRDAWIVTPEARNREIHTQLHRVRERVRQSARARFEPDIERFTIWDALEQEFYYRVRHQVADTFIGAEATAARAGNVSGYDLADMCDKYILSRVKHCIDSAIPFWDLDVARKAILEAQYPVRRSGIVAFSDLPFTVDDGGRMRHIQQQIGRIVTAAGFAVEDQGQSPHRIYVTSREVGAPLFMLNSSERDKLYEEEEAYTRVNGSAYIDERFKRVLPATFEREPEEIDNAAQAELNVGLALALGYLKPANGSARDEILATVDLTDSEWQVLAPDISGALERFQNEAHISSLFDDLIKTAWNNTSSHQRMDLMHSALTWIDKELRASKRRDGINPPSTTTTTLASMYDTFDKSMDVLV